MSSAEQVQVLVISPDEELEPDPDSTDKLSELTEDDAPISPFEDIEPEPEPEEDNQTEFTAESESQESTESEQFSTKSSRELKSILALAKEANLDTNIAHKRKSVEPTKSEPDGIESPKKPSPIKKLKSTEESDEIVEEDTVCNKVTKRKGDSINEKPTGGASEDKKSKKEIAPDLSMLKSAGLPNDDTELEPDPDSTDKLSELTEDEAAISPFEDIEPEAEPEEDNQPEFTAESESQESTEFEQFSTKSNRELKSILALAKEANLDTNIAHKRKSVEPTKSEPDGIESPKKPSAIKKLKSTEESDDIVEEDTVCNKVTKRKRDSINEKPTGGASENKKSKKEIAPDLSMLKSAGLPNDDTELEPDPDSTDKLSELTEDEAAISPFEDIEPEAEPEEDNQPEFTAESESQESTEFEQFSTKSNRELKSILAPAKEANLDTNIAHKRKSVEPTKSEPDGIESPKKPSAIKKLKSTEESDDIVEEDTVCNKVTKRKRDSINEKPTGGASENKKSKKEIAPDLSMLKSAGLPNDDTELEPDPDSTDKLSELTEDEATISPFEDIEPEAEPEEDNQTEFTAESESQESTEFEQFSTKSNRELKSILALAKEANLDTNIAHKRKSVEPAKSEPDCIESPKKPSAIKKLKSTEESDDIVEKDTVCNKVTKRKRDSINEKPTGGASEDKKSKKEIAPDLSMLKIKKDAFCWRCHKNGVGMSCETCPRSYHIKCIKLTQTVHWQCPECICVLKAESTKTRSPAMKDIDLEHLCSLLKYAHKRMMQISDSEPFMHPVNEKEFPDYQSYIIRPMDLTKLGKNIQANIYGSTNAFEADTKWILHNSIIFNSFICPDQSKLTTTAKAIVKVCKQEMSEIENCSNCYRNANTITEWFVEVCPKPHLLLWAKLKGFPYWPAKAMSVTSSGMVDVRFFGAHDRAWVSYKDCFLYSAKNPNANQMKKNDINECVKEVEVYIENLKKIYEVFKYAPYKTPYDPSAENLEIFLPKYSPMGIKPSLVKSPGSSSVTKSEDFEKTPEIDDTDDDSRDLIIDSNVGHVTGDSQIFEISVMEPEDEQEFPDSPKSKKRSRNSSTETSTKIPKLDVKKVDVNKPSEVDSEVDSENMQNQLTPNNKKDANKLRISEKLFLKLSKKDKKEGNETIETDQVEHGVEIKKAEKSGDTKKSELPLPPLVPISKTRKMEYEENDLLEVMYTEPVEILNNKDEEKMVKERVDTKSKEKDVESETEIDISEDSEQEEINEDPLELNECALDSVKNYLASHKKVKPIITSETKKSIKINEVKITKVSNNKNTVDEALINDVPKGCLERLKAGSVVIEKKTEQKPANSGISTPELRKSTEEVSKKRKASTDSKESDSSRKNLRVVNVEDLVESGSESVQSLLEKQLKNVTKADKTENKEPPKIPKKLSEKSNSEITESLEKIHDAREVCFVDIKNEPLSDEEAEHDLMAAKRKLLSALNISEKLPVSKIPASAAKPEIRTRSKTDEKAMKFRITDNLSQVIDHVATDYTKENGSATTKKNEKKPKNSIKQRARKSFPSPRTPPTQIKIAKKNIPITSTKTASSAANTVTVQANTAVTATPTTVINTPSVMAQCNPPTNMMILPQSLVLPQNPSLTYSSANPLITMVPHSGTSYANIILPQNQNFLPNINLAPFNVINNPIQAPQITAPQEATETTNSVTTVAHSLPTEITLLNGVYPETISRAMTEVLCKFPPRLKPRPPGPLGQVFEESAPSSVGPITAHINSVAHRLTDYFRGMLIETLCDVGKTEGNPEGTIANLRLELETLKHKHSEEILEIKKNVNTILQDIQKSVNEEKDKIVQETRAACELETLRRVEEAKSKQWCAMCLKEAQFYCCWNTSYCDYPCQTKHWPKHMSKCTQNSASQNQQNINLVPGMSTQPIILRPTAPPKGMGKVLGKTTKLIVNKSGNKMPLNIVKTTPQNTITLVESTPGKYEISVENSKMLNCPRFLNKIKSVVSSAVSSTATSASTTLIIQQNQSAKSSTSNGSAETN